MYKEDIIGFLLMALIALGVNWMAYEQHRANSIMFAIPGIANGQSNH